LFLYKSVKLGGILFSFAEGSVGMFLEVEVLVEDDTKELVGRGGLMVWFARERGGQERGFCFPG